jgi:MFS family permease
VRPGSRRAGARRGPFYGWIIVGTAFVTMGLVVNARTSFSLLFPSILDEFGWSRGLTASPFAVGLLVVTPVAPLLGLLMDRLGPRVVLPAGVALVSAGLALVMVAAQGPLGYGLAPVFGAIPAELFQGRRFGTIFGTLNLFSNAGAGIGPWLTGALHDRTGSYAAAFWLGIGLPLTSAAAIWLAAPRKARVVAGRAAGPGRRAAGAVGGSA